MKARRVDVVKNGVFENFLMSRSPIAGFEHSNGHGRNEPGLAAVARQSNLVVSTSQPVSRDALKKMLIDQIKQQNKPFGLLFDDIEGGFTITQRFIPNAFNVIPVMVYRVYPDGREELVRGVDLIGTPLIVSAKSSPPTMTSASSTASAALNPAGFPSPRSSPDILISQIEVQKKEKSQERAHFTRAQREPRGSSQAMKNSLIARVAPLAITLVCISAAFAPRDARSQASQKPAAPAEDQHAAPPQPKFDGAAQAGFEGDITVRALRAEMARSMKVLLAQLEQPYFIAYRVRNTQSVGVSASRGSLSHQRQITQSQSRRRFARGRLCLRQHQLRSRRRRLRLSHEPPLRRIQRAASRR